MLRNPIGFRRRLDHLQGSPVDFDLRSYDAPLAEITQIGEGLCSTADAVLAARGRELHDQARPVFTAPSLPEGEAPPAAGEPSVLPRTCT